VAVSVYLDASFLVPMFASQEPLTARASAYIEASAPEVVISDLAGAEFASAVARLTRMGALTEAQAAGLFADFDTWVARVATRAETTTADVGAAAGFIRRLAFNLRTPDALNIAIAQRTAASLATFDARMAESATALGLPLAAL
jgi:predicted nucleic acid-binding protein